MMRVWFYVLLLLSMFGVPLFCLLLLAAVVLQVSGEWEASVWVMGAVALLAVYNLGVEVGRLDPPRLRRPSEDDRADD